MSNHPFDSELTLLHEIACGSKKAFEKVYDRYFIQVCYFCRRYIRDEKAAEDLTLETFLKLWERFPHFTSLESIQAFLRVTAKNACLNYLRGQARMTARQKEMAYLLAQGGEDELAEQQITARVYEHVHNEIEKLPPQVRKVFRLAYVDGLSNQEIADLLKINNQSVRNHKASALKYLRMRLLQKDLYRICTLLSIFFLKFYFLL